MESTFIERSYSAEEMRAAHASAVGALDLETLRIQSIGAKRMREEAWFAEYRKNIRVSSLEWRPFVPHWLRNYMKSSLRQRRIVTMLLKRRVFML